MFLSIFFVQSFYLLSFYQSFFIYPSMYLPSNTAVRCVFGDSSAEFDERKMVKAVMQSMATNVTVTFELIGLSRIEE